MKFLLSLVTKDDRVTGHLSLPCNAYSFEGDMRAYADSITKGTILYIESG